MWHFFEDVNGLDGVKQLVVPDTLKAEVLCGVHEGIGGRGVASPSVMVGPVSSVVQLTWPKANLYAIRQYGPIKLFTL